MGDHSRGLHTGQEGRTAEEEGVKKEMQGWKMETTIWTHLDVGS